MTSTAALPPDKADQRLEAPNIVVASARHLAGVQLAYSRKMEMTMPTAAFFLRSVLQTDLYSIPRNRLL